MLKETLISASRFINLFDVEMVVCYPSPLEKCCLSTKTDDDTVYMFCKYSGEGKYQEKEFAFRDWKSIFYAVDSVYDTSVDESGNVKGLELKVIKDEFDYPSILELKNDHMDINYYVQNYSFLSKQQDLLNMYNKRKFELNTLPSSNADNLNEQVLKDMRRISTWLQDKNFRFSRDNRGNFIYIGDLNLSVDCAKIYVDGQGGNETWSDKHYFNIESFLKLVRYFKDESIRDKNPTGFKMKFAPTQIIMSYTNSFITKSAIMRGINI